MIQSASDDVEVVLDDEHRMAGINEAMQHVDQLFHVRHVQAHCGLVEHVERAHAARLGELAHQLYPLCFATGEAGALLP